MHWDNPKRSLTKRMCSGLDLLILGCFWRFNSGLFSDCQMKRDIKLCRHYQCVPLYAMPGTFPENLYLICCDLPFVRLCLSLLKGHSGKQRLHEEIINGDQYSVTLVGEMVVIFKKHLTAISSDINMLQKLHNR